MEHNGYPQLDPERTERLLDNLSAADAAQKAGTVSYRDPLIRLLAAAAAPARPSELAGQDAVLAAFRTAAASGAERPAGRVRRLLAIKISALVAALAIGGVAVAASGLVPGPFIDDEPTPPGSSTHSSGSATPTQTAAPSTTSAAAGSASPTADAAVGTIGRCRAYLAAPPGERSQALQRSELAALSAAASGDEAIEGYCTALLAPEKAGKPSKTPHPTPAAVTSPRPRISEANGLPQSNAP